MCFLKTNRFLTTSTSCVKKAEQCNFQGELGGLHIDEAPNESIAWNCLSHLSFDPDVSPKPCFFPGAPFWFTRATAPMHEAVKQNQPGIAAKLLMFGADPMQQDSQKDCLGLRATRDA